MNKKAEVISTLFTALALCMLISWEAQGALLKPVKDTILPGQTIRFWWTFGPDPDKDKGATAVRIGGGHSPDDREGFVIPDAGGDDDPQVYRSKNNSDKPIIFEFLPIGDETKVTDWHQEIINADGTLSGVWAANIKKESPWSMHPLVDLSEAPYRIPDLAPDLGSQKAIYTAVNLDMYLQSNPFGFLEGGWQTGDTLDDLGITISNGIAPGLEGIYWSTSPFVFDPDPSGFGFVPSGGMSDLLNSDTTDQTYTIIAQHEVEIPEPSSWSLLLTGTLAFWYSRIRKFRKRAN